MANIKDKLNNIKNALFGHEVRESIHDGIEAINEEVENTTSRQNVLENTFEQLTINAGNSNAELVAARVEADGTTHKKLGDRLNKVDSQIKENEKNTNFLFENKVGLVAHKGSWLAAPENSLKSIQNAYLFGYEMVELDLNLTSDEKFILMHDTTVDRTTNGTGNVNDMTLAEIKALNLNEYFIGRQSEEVIKIPTFEEAVKECAKYGLKINLDMKNINNISGSWTVDRINSILNILKSNNMINNVVFISFDPNISKRLKGIYEFAKIGYVADSYSDDANINNIENYGYTFLVFKHDITDDRLKIYNELNIPIYIYSANLFEDVHKNFIRNVRFIETDNVLPGGAK